MSAALFHLIDGRGDGGTERVAALLARGADRLISLGPPHPDLLRLAPRIRSLGIAEDEFSAPGDRIHTLSSRVLRLQKLRGAALIAHDETSHEAAVLARTAGGLPVFRVMHTSVHWMPNEHRRAFGLLSAGTDLYFCVEKKTYQEARRRRRAAFFLPQPIDLRRLVPRSRAGKRLGAPHGIRFLFVGRLEWAKGADLLIQAFVRVPRSYGARLILAGDGPEFPTLQDMARRCHVSDRVRFLGYRQDVGALYHGADAVVIPSRGEGGSLVALESLACGVPVLAAPVGGLRELMFRCRLSRYVAPAITIPSLTAGMLRFCRSPDTLRTAIRRLSGQIRERHDAERIAGVMSRVVRARLDRI